jgi:hypothetical protein
VAAGGAACRQRAAAVALLFLFPTFSFLSLCSVLSRSWQLEGGRAPRRRFRRRRRSAGDRGPFFLFHLPHRRELVELLAGGHLWRGRGRWSWEAEPRRSVPGAPLAPSAGNRNARRRTVLLVDGARKLADGDQLMWKQTVLVRGE